jgi:hypothetical protein
VVQVRRRAASDAIYALSVKDKESPSPSAAGLCDNCAYMRLIVSDRGSKFYMCALSATDSRFPKYLRLPVLQCAGYRPKVED